MTQTTHDLTRLPKWAQSEIKRLTQDNNHLRTKLAEGPEGSNVFADPYSDAARPLGVDTAVEFRIGESWGERFIVRLEGKRLFVSGGSSVCVHPRASNSFEVEVTR